MTNASPFAWILLSIEFAAFVGLAVTIFMEPRQ
jgi:hypothetical protein